jgi:hypothetical protein
MYRIIALTCRSFSLVLLLLVAHAAKNDPQKAHVYITRGKGKAKAEGNKHQTTNLHNTNPMWPHS